MEKGEQFDTYDKITRFVKDYALEHGVKNGVRVSVQSLSQLNSRVKSTNILKNSVPSLPEVKLFFKYVEKRVTGFNMNDLLMLDD